MRVSAQVIGVTGSVGKTSTKEALRLALAADGETHASSASYNNHWGVPLSLADAPILLGGELYRPGQTAAVTSANAGRVVQARGGALMASAKALMSLNESRIEYGCALQVTSRVAASM